MGKMENELTEAFIEFRALVRTQYSLEIKKIQKDNEKGFIKVFQIWLTKKGIKDESIPCYILAPNGGIECSKGMISRKVSIMRLGTSLPSKLWPEVWDAAVYLYNKTPNTRANW